MLVAFEERCKLLRAAGAEKLYAKILAPNDNSKNQIYLASDPSQLSALQPQDFSTDGKAAGILKAQLRLSWLSPNGDIFRAPYAQLIYYPQYPEVRLSGVLRGAVWAPGELISSREPGRVLLIGVRPDGEVIAHVDRLQVSLEHAADPEAHPLESGVLVPLKQENAQSTRELLLERLRSLHRADWLASQALTADGRLTPCTGPRCVGCTLEAKLGIAQNGKCEPDFLDWELKAVTWKNFGKPELSKAVTLMTPAPTGGFYKQAGAQDFVRRFGYTDTSGKPDRLNFGGRFFYGIPETRTGLTLVLGGYDLKTATFPNGGGIRLVTAKGEVAAEWDFSEIASRWARKHANACYVPAEKSTSDGLRYRYGNRIFLGSEPRLSYFFKSIADGSVYLDPGIKLENASSSSAKVKERHQLRAKFVDTSRLYQFFETVDLLA